MSRAGKPLNVLIVEDEALLAMDLESMLEDLGHTVVGEAACVRELHNLRIDGAVDLALVDMQLAENSTGIEASEYIRSQWKDTVIVFVTANPGKVPDDFGAGDGIITKPFTNRGMTHALEYLSEGINSPPPDRDVPQGFVIAPHLLKAFGQSGLR